MCRDLVSSVHISMKVTAGSAFLSRLEKVKCKCGRGERSASSERRQIIKCILFGRNIKTSYSKYRPKHCWREDEGKKSFSPVVFKCVMGVQRDRNTAPRLGDNPTTKPVWDYKQTKNRPATVTQTDCDVMTSITKPCFKQTYHHKYLSHEENSPRI